MSTLSAAAEMTSALGPDWLSADTIAKAGLVVLLLVVFAETGLLVGFFLPGDSLLFTAGLLVKRGDLDVPLWVLLLLVPLAAIVGDQVGYTIGRRAGPRVFDRADSRFFKREYVDKAYDYFQKYGPRTIVLARFVPVVRTFAPVVAGVSRMDRRVFTTYNVLGGILWGAGVTAAGYALGGVDVIADNVEVILILIVLISVIPIAVELLRARRRGAARVDTARDTARDTASDTASGPAVDPLPED
jgi:membrane-associated protein